MAETDVVPEWMEIGDSGAGSLDDAADGTRSRRFQVKYLLSNLTGYDAAEARLAKLAPLLRRGHRRGRMAADPVGGGWWVGTVDYANESLVTTEGVRFSGWEWETSEKSEHITQAWSDSLDPNAYIAAYTANGLTSPGINCPDFKGAIGVENDTVRGIEKPQAVFNWSETWIFPARYIVKPRPPRTVKNGAVRETIAQNPLEMVAPELCFKTNSKPFRGRPEGCVMLTGVRSARMDLGASAVPVTFSFSYSPLRENFAVGPVPITSKDGWDYLDVYYETESSNKDLVKRAKFVYVCRVFERRDFRELGLPDERPRWWLDEDVPGHEFNVPFGA